jgi:(p)ppGpp synthase/HD superfamily hydrolase
MLSYSLPSLLACGQVGVLKMHNLRTIQAKSYESQRRTAEETLLFFVPLAKYLDLSETAEELKNRSFGVLGK